MRTRLKLVRDSQRPIAYSQGRLLDRSLRPLAIGYRLSAIADEPQASPPAADVRSRWCRDPTYFQYPTPGNIRELQNVIERAVILARGAGLRFQLKESSEDSLEQTASVPTRRDQSPRGFNGCCLP